LITTGPYRYVRHPMYTAALLVMAPYGWLSGATLGPLLWLLLLAVLWKKSSAEEVLLMEHYDEYGRYRQSTGRFIPWPGRRR